VSSAPTIGTKGVPRREREQQIVDVAVAEFGEHGFARASMVEIAARAGISKPLIYQYFGSKDGLYLACLHTVSGELLARLDAAELSVDDSVASRIHPLQAIFIALEPQRLAWRLLFDPSMPRDGRIAAAAADYRRRTRAIATAGSQRFLRARGNSSRLDASALTDLWMGIVDSLVIWWLDHPGESAQDMVNRCVRLLGAVLTDP
jgi:AcrR family transcriptional regulator